ncbi:melanoma-associated antigen D2-like [Styela clava]
MSAINTDDEDIMRRANELVYLMLIREQSKTPVKRPDVMKHVLKEQKTAFNNVMKAANDKLVKVFGMEIVEIGEGTKKAYILRNKLDQLLVPGQDEAKRGLLFIILTLIFMSGNVMQDGPFWHALKKLGIEPTVRHAEFGDVKKLIMNEFARQMYLDVTRTPGSDPPQHSFKWGPRAYQEVTKLRLLDFVTELYEKSDSTVWKSQYRDATQPSD